MTKRIFFHFSLKKGQLKVGFLFFCSDALIRDVRNSFSEHGSTQLVERSYRFVLLPREREKKIEENLAPKKEELRRRGEADVCRLINCRREKANI